MATIHNEVAEIIYKRIEIKHIPELIDLRLQFLTSLKGVQPKDKTDALIGHLHQYYTKTIPDETFAGWIAWAGAKAVAVGALVVREQPGQFDWPDGRLGYILNMYTRPEYRNKGIGTEIIRKLINFAKETGLSRLELFASPYGEHLYRKHGFDVWKEPYLMLRFK